MRESGDCDRWKIVRASGGQVENGGFGECGSILLQYVDVLNVPFLFIIHNKCYHGTQ